MPLVHIVVRSSSFLSNSVQKRGVCAGNRVIILLARLQLEQVVVTGIASPAEQLVGTRASRFARFRHVLSQDLSDSTNSCSPSSGQALLCMQAAVQALDVVLLDDMYKSEKIPSIRLKATSLSTTWSHDCTLLLSPRGEQETISNRNYVMVRTAVSCDYFNSSLDVEEALLLVRFCSINVVSQKCSSCSCITLLLLVGVAHLCHL